MAVKRKAKRPQKARRDFMRALGWGERAKALGVTAVSAAVFFATVFSGLHIYVRVVLALAELCLAGVIIQKITGWEGWMGLLLVRGKNGFGFMEWFGTRFPSLCRGVVDYGLALCFGIPYSYYVFRSDKRKVALHVVLQLLLAWLLAEGAKYYFPFWFTAALVFAAGLAGFAYALICFQALKILTVPETPAGVMPVIPGVTIPLVEGIIAIAIVASVHEIAHGIMSVIEKLELKASGIVLLGFLPVGAFVEPDEEKFKEISVMKKRRILVAGSTSNFIFFLVFLALVQAMVAAAAFSTGMVKVHGVAANSTAYGVLEAGDRIVSVNGTPVRNAFDLGGALAAFSPGEKIPVETGKGGKVLVLGPGGKLGISVENVPAAGLEWLFGLAVFLAGVFNLTALLSFALSVFNILPVFITDGHRIVYEEFRNRLGRRGEVTAKMLAKAVGLTTLAILLLNLLPWFL